MITFTCNSRKCKLIYRGGKHVNGCWIQCRINYKEEQVIRGNDAYYFDSDMSYSCIHIAKCMKLHTLNMQFILNQFYFKKALKEAVNFL